MRQYVRRSIKSRPTREMKRRRREELASGGVLLGGILLALTAEGWAELILGAVGWGA